MDISRSCVCHLLKLADHQDYADDGHEDKTDFQVENKEQKHFPIVEPDAVVDPWTVVVHVQNTFFTSRTVMTSFGFEIMAMQAILPLICLVILMAHAPIEGYPSRFSKGCCQKRPKHHHKENDEDDDQYSPDAFG